MERKPLGDSFDLFYCGSIAVMPAICKGIIMKNKKKRIGMTIVGVFLVGFSIGLFKMAVWGTDPFTVFCNGLANLFHSSYGVIFPIISIVLFTIIWFLNRHLFGFATIFTMFGMGIVVDFFSNLLQQIFQNPGIPARGIFLAGGILIMCFASSLYFTADMGVSTYDSIALTLCEKTRFPFKICRITTDLICVLIGFAFGAPIGIGTLITAFFMGPLIQYFIRKFSEPFLYGHTLGIAERLKLR